MNSQNAVFVGARAARLQNLIEICISTSFLYKQMLFCKRLAKMKTISKKVEGGYHEQN